MGTPALRRWQCHVAMVLLAAAVLRLASDVDATPVSSTAAGTGDSVPHGGAWVNASLPVGGLLLLGLPSRPNVWLPARPPLEVGSSVWPAQVVVEVWQTDPDEGDAGGRPGAERHLLVRGVANVSSTVSVADSQAGGGVGVLVTLPEKLVVSNSGKWSLTFNITAAAAVNAADGGRMWSVSSVHEVFVIPGFLSLLPPLVTIVFAVWLKQVFAALVLGIWSGATLVCHYNAGVAVLRVFDGYMARTLTYSSGHAQVIIFCFLLGGLIGQVQRAGGAHGLGAVMARFAKSPAHVCAAIYGMTLLILFDDYSAILIVGTTFAGMVGRLGVSREKLAFIIHVTGTCFTSMVPMSSWVGVEVGYIQGEETLAFKDPFLWAVESIPYRMFPVLAIVFTALLVITRRDFGAMLEAEKAAVTTRAELEREGEVGVLAAAASEAGLLGGAMRERADSRGGGGDGAYATLTDTTEGTPHPVATSSSTTHTATMARHRVVSLKEGAEAATGRRDGATLRTAPTSARDIELDELNGADKQPVVETGPLDPDPDTPQRWYNAAVPFGVVAVSTFAGMYLDGLSTIAADNALLPASEQTAPTLMAVMKAANSFNALMWGSLFGVLVSLVQLMWQKIFSLGDALDAFVEGIKQNILQPVLILMLAWALGHVIRDVSVAEYLAHSVGSDLPPALLSVIISVLCFAMSFATGTAFGCMGVVFPLVVPLVASLTSGDPEALMTCVGAILGGSIFGNVLSPIADDSILAAAASGCTVASHVATMLSYTLTVAGVTLVFGYLPLGLGAWGVWTSLVICTAVMLLVLLAFGERLPDAPAFTAGSAGVVNIGRRPARGWTARFFFGTDLGRVVGGVGCRRQSRAAPERAGFDGGAEQQHLLAPRSP